MSNESQKDIIKNIRDRLEIDRIALSEIDIEGNTKLIYMMAEAENELVGAIAWCDEILRGWK